jgi:hypothetical protein
MWVFLFNEVDQLAGPFGLASTRRGSGLEQSEAILSPGIAPRNLQVLKHGPKGKSGFPQVLAEYDKNL